MKHSLLIVLCGSSFAALSLASGNETATERAARVVAISTPRPEYPYEARRHHMVGRGIAILEVEPSTGNVTHAYMAQSTGYSLLDNATLSAFRHWRFQLGVVTKVRIPIAYTINGEVITTVHVNAKPMDTVLSPFLGKGTVINGPMPQYPRTVPWREKRGEGLYELRVGPNGDAIKAKILKSSGDVVFDETTVAALENWRLRRGPMIIELPLSFHLTSTKYSVGIPKHP
jgi:TonB family protein